MKEFLKYYKNPNEELINYDLIDRKDMDEVMISYIVNACKSLEVCKNIRFLGYKINTDESNINPESYVTKRGSASSKQQKYIFINENRNIELILEFKLSAFDKKTNKEQKLIINKKLLVPKVNSRGYYTIRGKEHYLIYQLLESSTYKTAEGITVKSFLPISINREMTSVLDMRSGKEIEVLIYTINMFKKERDILLFYFAHYGFDETLEFFSVNRIMKMKEGEPSEEELANEEYMYFKMNSNFYLEVVKSFFDNYKYVKSLVGMIRQMYNNRTTFEQVYDKNYYITLIGLGQSTSKAVDGLSKGLTTLQFFERMLDLNTKRILKLDYSNKRDIFCLIRNIIQNYDEYRSKDNLDYIHKRLRAGEFVGALFTTILSARFNRIVSRNTITIKELQKMFAFNVKTPYMATCMENPFELLETQDDI